MSTRQRLISLGAFKKVLLGLILLLLGIFQSLALAQETLFVSALDEAGVTFVAPNDGTYRFTFAEGAYVNCPEEAHPEDPTCPGYLTKTVGYVNRPISWSAECYESYPGPGDWNFELGSWDKYATAQEAEDASRGEYVDIPLNGGDYVVLVIQDCKTCCFWDNSGGVNINVAVITPPTLSLTLTGCTTCQAGNKFTVQAHLTNPGLDDVPVEAKIGVRLPDGTQINLFGTHLEVPIPAGIDTTFPLLDFTVPADLPTGTWSVEGTLLEPQLGETFSREVVPFEVVP